MNSSLRERAEEIKILFESFDKDGSGYLDQEEMKDVLAAGLSRGFLPPGTELDKLLHEADKDGDGDITLIEFAGIMGFNAEIESYRALFSKVDTDGNGTVDQKELRAVLEAAGVEKPGQEVDKMLRKANKRRGDVLNFDEFVALMLFNSPLRRRKPLVSSAPLSENALEELRTAFVKYDSDKNGFIDKKELKELLKHEQKYEPSHQELKAIMKRVDFNGDGRLSLPEFIVMMGFKQEVEIYWEAFMKVDLNQSGRIEKDELTQILKGFGVTKPKKEAKRIMKSYGRKKSLSFDHFVDIMLSY